MFGKSNRSSTSGMKTHTTEALFKLLDTFLITVTCRGQIVVVSKEVEQHLGHCQVCEKFSQLI